MGNAIKITRENIDLCRDAKSDLDNFSVELAAMLDNYPVEIEFAEYRFVIDRTEDIANLIQNLDSKISAYDKSKF